MVKNPALCTLLVAWLACAVTARAEGETGGAAASPRVTPTSPASAMPANPTARALRRNAEDANQLSGEGAEDLFAAAVQQHDAKVAP